MDYYEEVRRYIEQMRLRRMSRMIALTERVRKEIQEWENEMEKSSGLQGSRTTGRYYDEIAEWKEMEMKAMADLKPCPFCGGEADMIEARETDDHFVVRRIECYCTRCGAKGNGYYLNGICAYGDEKACREAAMRAWNNRKQEE